MNAVADSHFGEDAGDVTLDHSLGGTERVPDFAIAVASGHLAQDLDLTSGQMLRRF